MDYLKKSFSVKCGGDEAYRANHDRIFGKRFDSIEIDGTTFTVGAPQCERPGAYATLNVEPETVQQQVREFHEVYGQPIVETPSVPSPDRVRLRLKLIAEEFFELLAACEIWPGCRGVYASDEVTKAIDNDLGTVDLVEVADALADLAYVIEGANLEFGIDSAAVLAEVHSSNLSKLGPDGKPVYNDSGKVVKGPKYKAPDIAKVLGL